MKCVSVTSTMAFLGPQNIVLYTARIELDSYLPKQMSRPSLFLPLEDCRQR